MYETVAVNRFNLKFFCCVLVIQDSTTLDYYQEISSKVRKFYEFARKPEISENCCGIFEILLKFISEQMPSVSCNITIQMSKSTFIILYNFLNETIS